ncbi:MAG: hypothetical protein BGO98_08930 [Myxococcales bacterium 68-20]|nr:hypothetical protein [Myxococcales bacterium]OJY25113.1 MAG: hypothetical protein BGO98_08930 [Myxococcales bacterium 68-20]
MTRSSLSKRLLALVFTGCSLVIGVVSALPSCNGPPDKTCFADRVHALGVDEDTDAGPDRACTRCLQTRNAPNACCDAVGACDEDPTKQCVPAFQAAHRCVIDGGPSEEARCKALLTNGESKRLYACMRSNCGKECNVPSCDLRTDVDLIVKPECDNCMGGFCCEKINACYESRRCKVILECITKHCPRTLGPAMTRFALAPAELQDAGSKAVCEGVPSSGDDGPGACLQRCLDEGDRGTEDDQRARCLAFGVFECGAKAGCGAKCVQPDAGPYSGDGPWPEEDPGAFMPDASSGEDASSIRDASAD